MNIDIVYQYDCLILIHLFFLLPFLILNIPQYYHISKINFLDIGIGSGCILLSILKERKDFRATGIDISNHALKVCKINAYKLGVKNRIKLFKSD